MTTKRLRLILAIARQHGVRYAHRLYVEVYGADFSGNVTPERAVQSVIEACQELLDKHQE